MRKAKKSEIVYNDKGQARLSWDITFGPGPTFVACGLAGIIAGFMLLIRAGDIDLIAVDTSVARGALMILGFTLLFFLTIGVLLAWGLGFMMRNVSNQFFHALAFGGIGIFVGFSIGNFIAADAGVGEIFAQAFGFGSFLARWAISRYAKI